MPALNEEDNIEKAIANAFTALSDLGLSGEVIVINDGSTDRTAKIVESLKSKYPEIRMINHSTPQGIGASFWEAVDAAKSDAVVLLPGDNENDPWEIFRYARLLQHVDIVIPFLFDKNTRSLFRNGLSFLYRFIINSTFLVYFNYTNGTVIYRTSILRKLGFRSEGFFFQTDILIRLVKQGYLFAEVPYRINHRQSGVSKAVSFPSLLQVIKGYLRLAKDYHFDNKIITDGSDFTKDSQSLERHSHDHNKKFQK